MDCVFFSSFSQKLLSITISMLHFWLIPVNMEINKPLQDWEISCLAERMSPMEFDQIARSDLGMTKVSRIYFKLWWIGWDHGWRISHVFCLRLNQNYEPKYTFSWHSLKKWADFITFKNTLVSYPVVVFHVNILNIGHKASHKHLN